MCALRGRMLGEGRLAIGESVFSFSVSKEIKHIRSHAMLVDQKTEGVIVPLNRALTEAKGKLELANSGY